MLDHISLGVTDLARATAFYDAVLAPMGYVRQWTGDAGVEYGAPGGGGKFALFAKSGAHAPGDGWHLAITAPHRDAVDQAFAAAVRGGAVDDGSPGLRPQYGPGYYAAFFRDLEGYKIELVFHEHRDESAGG